MVLTLIEWIGELPWLAIAAAVWAVWVATLLSFWTYAAAVGAAVLASGSWGWSGSAALDAAAIVLLAGYVVDCLMDPRANCWWCRGAPKRRNRRSFFHLCFICKGSGQRKRWGSKVLARHRESAGDVT